MERKGHHTQKHNVVSQTVKETVGKVEGLFQGLQMSSHASSSHHGGHQESSCHQVTGQMKVSESHQVTGHMKGFESHHVSGHMKVSESHHVTGHMKGSESHHVTGHIKGSESHHITGHIKGSESHQVTGHIKGSESHHVTGHIKGSESHHVTGHIQGSESHHVTGHIQGSESHHVTAHGCHGSVSHQETLKAPEPIKGTPSIGGFFLFQTKEKVGIYQALQKKLVSEEVALALLEAQAATGNITDLSTNQQVTVLAAIQQGIVGSEYEQKLLLASNAVTGYKDKEETISLFQAFKKGLVGKNDAVRFLQAQIATGGIINYLTGSRVTFSEALKLNYIDESFFKVINGPSEFSNSYPDPNSKKYSSYQEILSKCFTDSQTGLLFLTLQESLQGLRKAVTPEQLYMANIITQGQYDEIREGKITIQKLGELQEVRQYLSGLSSIGGIYVESTKENISIYQALKRNFLSTDCAVALLEAQAASGFIIDPEKNKTFTVTEAIQEGVVGFDLKEKLLNAERALTGFKDPYTGKKISLFQAIRKELIDRNLGLSLLQVQLATGGIIDPLHSFRVPLEIAYKRGLLDEDTAKLLSSPANLIRGFIDPNTNDRVTYQELRSRSTLDAASNTYFFHLKLAFEGLRGKVTSDELLDSHIIDQATYENLQQGKLSVQDVAEQEQVKRYLQGTGLIAGVADFSTNEIKTIYQAMKEHLLMPGTAIALLEAQASTGYLIDPIKNLKFSVKDAVKNGLIGPELYEKLLTAEKAATGYKDPSSGERLSLFQAIKKGFVSKDHGIHLLNAQLATGGILDPSKKHRVPAEVAYKRGHFDEDTNKILLSQTNDIKGFFDPNLKENVTYEQLLERSVIDVQSGLYLTPVYDNTQDTQQTAHSFIDYKTKVIFEGIKLTLTFGKFKGHLVSLWQILFSEYFSVELRQSFIKLYKAGSLSVEELSKKVEAEVQQAVSSTKVTFKGLRESVTPGQLFESEIIDKNLYDKLQQGEASAKDVANIETVRKYLQGTGSIGGLILADTQEKISIYQAKRKGFLRPGTSLILLEAQAATGYIIDPVKNKKYSVDEALKENIIGPEYYEKLLSAEKSVIGYKDPYTGERISLFQAMSKGLIVDEHGIRLLEAQIATGGIIDPINSHRIPVEVAYKRGYFDKKMNLILSDPSDDTKGFFDPNTHENLTYLQLKEKCITEPSTNLCLLPLANKQRQFSITDQIRDSLRNVEISVRYGKFQGQTLSLWFLINSEYFSEWRRKELLEQFRLKKVTIEQIIIIIEEEIKRWTEIRIPALRGQVNIYDLFEYEIIEKEVLDQVLEGSVTIEDVLKMDNVRKYLQGSGVLGGVIIQPSNKKISFYEATKNNILLPSTILPLLEAQAATGHIVDPANNQKLTVDAALKAAVVDPQIYDRLASAEEAATGYRDPFSGKKISLFQAMKKGLIEEKHAKQLLEAQLATGGVIDPVHGFHLPDSVAKKHGHVSEDLLKNLSHSTDETKSFYDPTTKERVTYSELLSRSQKDESTGLYLLPLAQDFAEVPVINLYSDEEVRQILMGARIEERNISIWELIHSGYFTEEQRFEILGRFKAKRLTILELTTEILQIVKTNETKRTTHINFQGLRGNVPVVWLLDLGIITQKTFDELIQGIKSVEEVSQLAEVKKSLQGTGSISGVFLPSTKEKLSIYQALKKNILLPANAIMLLEAQAATGFIVDPVKNEKYTVDNAIKAGLVGPELHEKLLTAESAVSGYTDPYTGNKISVGQAIQKKLIPDKEGIPLLQAQLATGGIIDPLHCHYVPLQLAYKLGFLDEEISRQTADQKIYVDPNTKEKVSYEQLKERCYTDPETGSLLLPVSESTAFYAEGHFIDVFKSFTVTINAGRFKGQTVSLWELLNSEYISPDKRKEFLLKYKTSSSEALQEIIKTVTTIFEEAEATSTQIKFKGLRKQVSASDLFQSDVIDKKTLDELNLGKKTIDEVTKMDTVKRYLEGTNCIAGVLLQATNKKMSIYEAMLKRILRPGTALVLLEAQAATGFVLDPVKNEKLSVDEALAKGLIGSEVHAKLLSAEQAVTGYKDPYRGEKISLFQAMQNKLIVETHGIRLLEAQIATGGIIDPVHSHRVPVDVAYKRGYFNEEMNKILSDPSDDTKGFFDPNTHENLTYMQLVERCIQDPETGLYLLQVIKKGENYFYITEKMKADLQSRTIRLQFGRYANQNVSIWEILTSHYITDLKRRELVRLYTLGVLSIDQLISTITTVIEEYESKSSSFKLKGIRGEVSATDLYNADIIDRKTLSDLQEGKISVEAVSELDSVKRYLKGTGCIAGVLSLPTNETLSINQAISRGILSRDIGLSLLQAQAATGHLIDPIKNEVLSIPDAVSQGLVNSDVKEQLEGAEKAVTGYTDEKSGNRISLFQAIKKGIVPKGQGISLLDAQLATGGVVDPVHSHRLPLHVAYQRDHLGEDLYLLISDSGKKGFVDPNTHERITYKNLLERCVKDQKTGLYLLPLSERHDDYFYIDDSTKKLLQETNVTMSSGKFNGQVISLWELLTSTYISEEKKKQIIKLYKTKTSSTLKDIVSVITSTIEEKEKGQTDIWFQGLRKQVTAAELFDAQIINQETLDGLKKDLKTVNEVAKIDSIRRYLEGTSCIAGVIIPSKLDPTKKEKVNIYDAMLRRVLRPGTALVLLEAQAATGFVIDSIQNRKLSVDEALSAGVIGYEIYEKLLSAERGVTGYNDPYTGEKISLFQAMQKDLIVKYHGVRLLEAQIATGGIIDPVHSHRVPVEVAYKRGYFDEEMNQILSDPTDDTKGFFDPNTHENLTYLQLLQRCIQDPDTGLYMLELKDSKFSPAQIQNKLQSSIIQITVGEFQGKSVSIWELINSKYFSAERREELLKKFESGNITIEEILAITIKVINEKEQTITQVNTTTSQADTTDSADQEARVQTWLQSEKVNVSVGDFKGQSITVWELLNSRYISGDKRREILEKLQSGTLTIQELITILITIITETETEVIQKSVHVPDEKPVELDHSIQDDEIEKALTNISIHVTKGQYAGQEVSVWDLLNSRYIPENTKQELLEEYKLTVQDIMELVVLSIKETEQSRFKTQYNLKVEIYNVLQTVQIDITEGEFKGQKQSIWYLLNSKYFSEEKRSELLEKFNSGTLSIDELIKIITTIITETEERSKKLKFKGLRRQVTATELLTSEIIDQNTLRELAQGQKTVEEITQLDSVKRYLEGTSCIAGVLVPSPKDPSKKDKMNIYDAMLKNILRPGTALVLLEAQAATGFIVDSVSNKKLSVDEAAAARIIGLELHKKLLSAEKAVTGYTDPYTGDKISLFQAMQKDLIVKDHGIRLLEAQIATGGIIDPVHSHRVPVEVAYKRGYFDEEMNQILSDPTDDTKGFFDPNTHENLTYLQLLSRCVQDPDTGLYMLIMKDKQTILADKAFETSLQTIIVQITIGQYGGQSVSAWELLHSKYFTEEKRQLLLSQYKSKAITVEEFMSSIKSTVEALDQQDNKQTVDDFSLEEAVGDITAEITKSHVTTEKLPLQSQQPVAEEEHKALSVFTVHVQAEEFHGKRVSLWEVLHSRYVSDDSRSSQLRKHQAAIEKLKQRILRLIEDPEIKSKTKTDFQKTLELKFVEVKTGEFKGQNVSLWFLLYSKYITEEKRAELLEKYKLGSLTEDEIIRIIITIIEETEQTQQAQAQIEIQQKLELKLTKVNVGELKGQNVSLWFLLYSKYITEEKRTELLEKYKQGSLTEDEFLTIVIKIIEETEQTQQVQVQKEVQQKLETKLTKVNVGEFKGQNVSLWFLLYSKYITEEKRTELLEKYKQGSLTEDEFLTIVIKIIEETEQTQQVQVQKEVQQKLETKLTEVNVGEFKGQNVSLWFLLYSKYITEEKRTELLEKYKQGSLTEDEFLTILITIIEETEVKREKEIQQELELKLTEVTVGEFKGQNVSVWFLLYSKYITEEKRNELLGKYKSGTLTVDELLKIIITIIEETEKRRDLKFKGLRRQVTASELLNAEIIDQTTLNELTQGNKTVEEVTQMDSVKRYLEGSSSIAGVFIASKTDPSKKDKLTIYDAMFRRILRPGTALILLEAQAATGFMIDPIQNKKLSVEEALASGLIGQEIYDKLLSAERGVTGYKDPYTGEKISLFQAMKKDLIIKDHGIRLLEAQIATGGIIDPIHSHRVPVEVAYKRGYFDEEMNQILSDPSDDTKGFFDPNTHENLTYLQLLQRCVQDPETGLYMLDVSTGTSVSQEELKIKSALQSKTVEISVGDFQGKNVSVWDLLYSRYIVVEKQQELLKKYRAGTLTIEELITILITIITETDKDEKLPPEIKVIKKSFLSVKIEISIGDFHEKSMSLWDLLHSKYIPDDKREELIQKFKAQTLSIQEIINIVLSMIQKEVRSTKTIIVQEKKIISNGTEHWPSEDQLQKALEVLPSDLSGKPSAAGNVSLWAFLHGNSFPEDTRNMLLQTYKSSVREVMSTCTSLIKGTATEAISIGEEKQNETAQSQKRVETQNSLQSVEVDLTVGNQETKKSSLWELLHAAYIKSDKRNELLAGYESGALGIQDLMNAIMPLLMEAEKTSVKIAIRQKVTVKTEQFSLESIPEPVIKSLQVFTVSISSGEFTGENNSLWDLLQSKSISMTMRLDLLKKYFFTITSIVTMLTGSSSQTVTVITKKPDTVTFLKSVRVQVDIGEFKLQGQSHSLWDLLHSQYITEEKRNELVHQYESGAITWEQMFNNITTIIKETEEKTRNIKFTA